MSTLTEQAAARCKLWIKHSGLTVAEIARRADVAEGTVRRLDRGESITTRALMAIESTVPKNFRDPYVKERHVA